MNTVRHIRRRRRWNEPIQEEPITVPQLRAMGALAGVVAAASLAGPTVLPAVAASPRTATAKHTAAVKHTAKKHAAKQHAAKQTAATAAPADSSSGATGLDGIDDNSTNPAVFGAQQVLLTIGEVVTPANIASIIAQL